MKFDYSARVRAGIILLILFALYSNLQVLLGSVRFDLSFVGNDDITRYEKRFDEVRKMLPPHGAVGYTGDALHNEDGSLNSAALSDWYLAQYTVAPVVLSRLPGHRLFLINRTAGVNSDPPAKGGFTIQELGFGNKILDFGNGVQLLSSESQ